MKRRKKKKKKKKSKKKKKKKIGFLDQKVLRAKKRGGVLGHTSLWQQMRKPNVPLQNGGETIYGG